MEVQREAHKRAVAKLNAIKEWYGHIILYLTACLIYALVTTGVVNIGFDISYLPRYAVFTLPLGWGLGIVIHGIYVHYGNSLQNRIRRWEKNKIDQILNKEEPSK